MIARVFFALAAAALAGCSGAGGATAQPRKGCRGAADGDLGSFTTR